MSDRSLQRFEPATLAVRPTCPDCTTALGWVRLPGITATRVQACRACGTRWSLSLETVGRLVKVRLFKAPKR